MNKKINFNEETHTYTLGDRELISVTQLLRVAGISPDYNFVNQETLKRASEYGSFIHNEIEDYIKKGEEGLSGITNEFQKFLNKSGLTVVESEKIVFDETVAGTIDLVLKDTATGELSVWDIKTTSVVHKNSVSWQDSIYAHLYEKMFDCKIAYVGVLHIKDNEIYPTVLLKKPEKSVLDLFGWYINKVEDSIPFTPVDSFVGNTLDELREIMDEIKIQEAKLKLLEEEKNAICNTIKESILKVGETSIENKSIRFTYVPPIIKKTFNQEKFKEENEELYKKYIFENESKPQFRVTLKKE